MRFRLLPAAASLTVSLVLGGCISDPYPDQGNLFLSPDASIGANDAPRGSAAYCRNYARQSQDNFYESNSDPGDGFGSNAMTYRQAQAAGDRSYRRCLAGRTN